MRVYLDTCCLNRPFDNLAEGKVAAEAAEVVRVIAAAEAGLVALVASPAHRRELADIRDPVRRAAVMGLLAKAGSALDDAPEVQRRAAELAMLGFGEKDAAHLAFAVSAACDVLLTVDERLVRRARRHASRLTIVVANPCKWRVVDGPADQDG